MGGLQERREDVMAWLTTGMFQHTLRICLDNARTGHGGFVFSWLLLNELLSFRTLVTSCDSTNPRSYFPSGMYHLTTMTASDWALFCTHLCDPCMSALCVHSDYCSRKRDWKNNH